MTIADLERRAGIEQTPEGRASFWKPFAHLEAQAMLEAGCNELKTRIEARELAAYPAEPSPAEVAALRAFANAHGRYWKAELRRQWMNASASPTLHHLRNRLGPAWLCGYRLK